MSERKQYTFTTWSFTWFFDPSPSAFENFTKLLTELGPRHVACHKELIEQSDATYSRLAVSDYLELSFGVEKSPIKFICAQAERCPISQNIHMQGVVVFKKSECRKACIRALRMPQVHVEPSHHDLKTNVDYCSKERSRLCRAVCFGIPPMGRGSRTDLIAVYEMALQQATAKEMLHELGAAGMRHLVLYQKTVKVLQDDDIEDQRILNRRVAGSAALATALARFRPEGGPSDDDDDN